MTEPLTEEQVRQIVREELVRSRRVPRPCFRFNGRDGEYCSAPDCLDGDGLCRRK